MLFRSDLHKVLSIRNTSLMAHGFQPVSEETYGKLLQIALSFLELSADQLPRFPVLDFFGQGL